MHVVDVINIHSLSQQTQLVILQHWYEQVCLVIITSLMTLTGTMKGCLLLYFFSLIDKDGSQV